MQPVKLKNTYNMTAKQSLPKHTYEDAKGQLHYVHKQTQKEYLIPDEKQKVFRFLNERYVIGIAIGIVLYGIKVPIIIAGVIACLIIILLSIYRRQKFFTSLKTGMIHKQSISQQHKEASICSILMTIMIMIFSALNCVHQNYLETNKNALYLTIGVILLSFMYLIRLAYERYQKKEVDNEIHTHKK